MTERMDPTCAKCPLRNGGPALSIYSCTYEPPNGIKPCRGVNNAPIVRPDDFGTPRLDMTGGDYPLSRQELPSDEG